MKLKTLILPLLLITLLIFPAVAFAQESSLTIKLSRDFGYGGFNNDIQGTFSIRASGPEELVSVHFFIDDTLMGTIDAEPFNLQFNTSNYEPGIHTIYALGILEDGTELRSNEKINTFLSGKDAMSSSINLVVSILVVVGLFALVGVLLPALLGKKGKIKPLGEYGIAGGCVCTKCGSPFSRNVLSPNMLVGKLSRCPHCGKLQIARRALPDDLIAAEAILRKDSQDGKMEIQDSEEDRLRKMLDDSQFED